MAEGFDLAKVVAVGKELGLEGQALKDFLEQEHFRFKEDMVELQETQKQMYEAQVKAHEAQRKAAESQLKVEEARRESSLSGRLSSGDGFTRAKSPKLPTFNQDRDDIDAYIHRFERYATSKNWDKESEWAINLGALLQGKALFEYSALSTEDSLKYDVVKAAVLKAYGLTDDGFRKKFRTVRPTKEETGTRFSTRLKNLLQRWLELSRVKDYDGLFDLILREQFLNCCSQEHATFLRERKPADIKEMAKYTDQYLEAHEGWYQGGTKAKTNQQKSTRSQEKSEAKPSPAPSMKTSGSSQMVDTSQRRRGSCFICGKRGHFAKDCRQRQSYALLAEVVDGINKVGPASSSPSQLPPNTDQESKTKLPVSLEKIASCIWVEDEKDLAKVQRDGHVVLQGGHKLTGLSAVCGLKRVGSLPTYDGKVGQKLVKVLRDTGCSGVVVKSSFVETNQVTGEYQACVMIDGTVKLFPKANISVDTPFFRGNVTAVCMKSPVCDLIIGNIPGARGAEDPDPRWREGCTDHSMEVDEKASAATVLTRRQAQIESQGLRKLKVSSPIPNVTPDMLSTEQEKDVTLKKCRELAKSGEVMESKNGSSHRYVKENGILFREFQSPKVEFGNVVKQVVVPKCYRDYVMKVAHESILGGHQGSSRTYDKVRSSFIWPGLHADITRYCQSCDVCQRMCPKGRVSKVPLGSTPLIEEPFQRIAVDLVGPIKPSSARGHRYILVIVDYAARYPDAIPLKTIGTETVTEGLLDVFSRVGIPKEILTDQGTQFVSNLMKEVSRLLSIRRLVTTPYHDMCNGLVEKFNGTIKAMLKKMCEEKPQDWDRFISPLLFAYREIPQESTGFSPFELMYGRTVRGPMMILKELWTGSNESSETRTTYQYVMDLQDRLEQTCQLAHEEARKSQKKYATYYNRRTRERQLAEGDEVLLLLPTDNNKLLMHWKGPFLVEKKVNAMNYKINLKTKVVLNA
ncbi:hypothetical protein HOLleu_03495 [Holothuria leucospilota]|uniref:Tick transposon n=1 Tax=Holothuria leucospilota TaxID=206669 RepID=A0A9Q1CS21_HOLLE|nr:hypothetical protein HOLleu_03495 [Holothuria leucospilota]